MKKTIKDKQKKQKAIDVFNNKIVEAKQSYNSVVAKEKKLHQCLAQVLFFLYIPTKYLKDPHCT